VEKVTACVLGWRRPHNLRPIVANLGRHSFVDEILIWANDPAVPLDIGDARVRVIRSPGNLGCYGRYLCAEQARNRVVYVQDDDCLLANMDELADAYRRDPARLAHALRPGHFEQRHLDVHGDCQVALVGWGAFLLRDWVSVLDRVPGTLRDSGLFRREADRFFSVLLERMHTAIVGDIRLLDGHSEPGVALWVEPGHRRMAARAVREALRLVRERRSPGSPAQWHVVVACGRDESLLPETLGSVATNAADYELTVAEMGGRALNLAIRATPSELVTWLQAGDLFGPLYLREAAATLAAGGDIANPDAILTGAEVGRWPAPAAVTVDGLKARNTIHYAAAFRRRHWEAVSGFDERLAREVHHDFWIRLMGAGARVRRVPGDHFFHRRPSAARDARQAQCGSAG
jgi:hypothetical protein